MESDIDKHRFRGRAKVQLLTRVDLSETRDRHGSSEIGQYFKEFCSTVGGYAARKRGGARKRSKLKIISVRVLFLR